MDVMDAGVYVSKWEAKAPKHTKVTLWGPLAAKEMGLEGWDVQDGGETGFVMHNPGVKLTMGRATSTLIFVRRLERAFLTVYFGGYPADAPAGQRKLDMQKVVSQAEIFLTRIAKEPVRFEFQGELALVDNTDAPVPKKGKAAPAEPKALGGGKLGRARGDIIDADEELARERSALVPPEHRRKARAGARGAADEDDEPEDKDDKDGRDEEDPVDALARKAGYVSAKDAKARAAKAKAIETTATAVERERKGKGKNEVWEV